MDTSVEVPEFEEQEQILPPHNVEAEQDLLGAVLLNPDTLPMAASIICPSDFFTHKNRWVWDAIGDVVKDGQEPDPVTVAFNLQARGKLEELGGPAYLAELVNAAPSSLHAADYAKLVKADSRKRQGLELASFLAQGIAHANNGTVDAMLAQAATRLEALRSQAPTAADPWKLRTLQDAYAARPPLVYAVEGLLPLPSLTIVYGAPGCLKTNYLTDLLACVASGQPHLPPLPGGDLQARATTQLPVCWLDFDNGTRATDEHIEAACRARQLAEDVPFSYYSMPSPWLDAGNAEQMDSLVRRVRDLGARVIGIDNLGVISGGADENTGQMIPVLSNLRRLSEETDAAVIVIHHERKATGFAGRTGERMRGFGGIEAEVDLALLVEREEGSDSITIRSTKVRKVPVHPYGATFTYEHKPGTTELATFRFFGFRAMVGDLGADIEVAILEAVRAHPGLNGSQLVAAVKSEATVGHDRIRQVANGLAARGELKSRSGPRGSVLYDV